MTFDGFGIVLRNAFAIVISRAKTVLRIGISLFRRPAKQFNRFGMILTHTPTFGMKKAKSRHKKRQEPSAP
jgi:hypothetical protein